MLLTKDLLNIIISSYSETERILKKIPKAFALKTRRITIMKRGLRIASGVFVVVAIMVAVLAIWRGYRSETTIPEVPALLETKGKSRFDFDILADIQKAQAMLEHEDAGYDLREDELFAYIPDNLKSSKKKPKKPQKRRVRRWKVKKLDDFNVLLAVEDVTAKNRKIEIITLGKKGREAPEGFSVEFPRLNGVNTEFKIKYPKGYVVLALKRVVHDGRSKFKEVVYTPYTQELDVLEVRKAGLDYLRTNIDRAEAELSRQGVESLAFGGPVPEAVPTDVALVLSVIEHIDPARFMKHDYPGMLVNEVLTTVGANQERAYRYAVSKAKARGLFQFIPNTYQCIAKRYPKACLMGDFVGGMDNHLNAAKASLLLFDSDIAHLRKERRAAFRGNPELMGKYLAAAYNGGAGRARMAIRKHGDDGWEEQLLPETVTYLKKFEFVWKILHE